MRGYIQVGQAAMRDPVTGEMLQAVPLYIAAEDREKIPEADLNDIGKLLAGKMKEYLDGCKRENLPI